MAKPNSHTIVGINQGARDAYLARGGTIPTERLAQEKAAGFYSGSSSANATGAAGNKKLTEANALKEGITPPISPLTATTPASTVAPPTVTPPPMTPPPTTSGQTPLEKYHAYMQSNPEAANAAGYKYQQGLATAQASGQPAPSAGAGAAVTAPFVPKVEEPKTTPNVDNFNQTNPIYQQSTKDLQEFLMPQSLKNDMFKQMKKVMKGQSELSADKMELMDIKRVMEGTEQDIRDEITKAGGIGTHSDVMALGIVRNNTLLKQAQLIQDHMSIVQDAINTDTNLLNFEKDMASTQFSQNMSILNYQQQNQQAMMTAAKTTWDFIKDSPAALAQIAQDPVNSGRLESMFNLPTGTIAQMATEQPAKEFQFISGTENQPMGYFDKTTGKFTRLGGGSGGSGGSGNYALTPEQQNDPFIKLLASTAGGKPITDTFAQSLNKGLNVLGQIGVLQTNIKDTKTGPIAGAFKGANPWDTNAQTIKAQLNAIIPNLARGVYGEVGVLTDNDIQQYAKTLPNLKSTEDIRNAVLGITVDLIGKSIKRTLEINAANHKDVSGFIDIYTEMNATRDSIFSQIPGYTGTSNQTNTQAFRIPLPGGGSLDLGSFEN